MGKWRELDVEMRGVAVWMEKMRGYEEIERRDHDWGSGRTEGSVGKKYKARKMRDER